MWGWRCRVDPVAAANQILGLAVRNTPPWCVRTDYHSMGRIVILGISIYDAARAAGDGRCELPEAPGRSKLCALIYHRRRGGLGPNTDG